MNSMAYFQYPLSVYTGFHLYWFVLINLYQIKPKTFVALGVVLKIHYKKSHCCCKILSFSPQEEQRLGTGIKGSGSGILCFFRMLENPRN